MSALLLLAGLALAAAPPPIINGEDASEEDYPMAGAMLMDAVWDLGSWGQYPFRALVCSSTLIAPDVVLVAAHCLDETSFTFGVGDLTDVDIRWTRTADLSHWDGSTTPDWPDDAVAATHWVKHESFDLFSMGLYLSLNYDIGLIFLEAPLYGAPLSYLPTRDEAEQIALNSDVVIVGWGQQIATEIWEAPPAGSYGIKQMADSYISDLDDFELQVGAQESDGRKCHGDSGGPTFMDVTSGYDEPMRQIGVTSHAYDETDCFDTGGVDTRVDYYLGWIDEQLRTACEDGLRSWCDEPGILEPGYVAVEGGSDTGDTGGVGDTADTGGAGDGGTDSTGDSGGDGGGDGGEDTGSFDPGETGGAAYDEELTPAACGCAAPAPAGAALWVVGLLGLAIRRRDASIEVK